MASPNRPAAPFAVEDPAAAFRNLENFARKILAVPKKELDKKMAAGKNRKRKAH